jgi:hypothetical protein
MTKLELGLLKGKKKGDNESFSIDHLLSNVDQSN